MKEKLVEMKDEQSQLINEQVKRTINVVFQRLKTRIRLTKQYTGEQFLSRSLEIIKKATLKVLSNNEDDQSTDDVESDDENEQIHTADASDKTDQLSNENSVDQKTSNEDISLTVNNDNEENHSNLPETTSTSNTKNGWDTIDDLQQESKIQSDTLQQNQLVVETEDTKFSGIYYSNLLASFNEEKDE